MVRCNGERSRMIWSFLHRVLGTSPGQPARDVPPPSAPEGLCVYAVGDIHGERRCLERLLAAIAVDAERLRTEEGLQPLLVFLGDYVDRGPDSRGVIERLQAIAADASKGTGPACRFLLGNHEAAMLDFLRDPPSSAEWLAFGGIEALASYGVRASAGTADPARCRALRDALEERMPVAHRQFLESLETMVTLGDYTFVHAGVRPGVALDRQKIEDLLWIREPFLSSHRWHGKVVVHGHTVMDQPQILPNRIGLDTGAYATGLLTAVALHGGSRRIIQARG
ncbi:metallophosphoesterase family protein [Azospirillum sp. SYSU D00513]|uniref:metallophosphoesterase family protein n=1 Tax=Azospirillum sp. SYSU D00513 TaxID=2812561 RepID=UPI001FFEADC6|nr:metallophosphoesterase family protein [Azospirillum sp. SYSU D00513]